MTAKTKKAAAPEVPKPKPVNDQVRADPVNLEPHPATDGDPGGSPETAAAQTDWDKLGLLDPSGQHGIESATLVPYEDDAFTLTAYVGGKRVEVDVGFNPKGLTPEIIAQVNVSLVESILEARRALDGEPYIDAPEWVTVSNVKTLDQARALPVLIDAVFARPTEYEDGSIEQFKAEDRRTMRVVGTIHGDLAALAVAVESEAANG